MRKTSYVVTFAAVAAILAVVRQNSRLLSYIATNYLTFRTSFLRIDQTGKHIRMMIRPYD